METFGKYKFVPLFLSGTGSNLYQRRNVPLQLHFNEKFVKLFHFKMES